MDDIELEHIVIRYGMMDEGERPSFEVDNENRRDYDERYTAYWGAKDPEFDQADTQGRLAMLFALFVHLTTEEKIRARELDEALRVIPEYRRLVYSEE